MTWLFHKNEKKNVVMASHNSLSSTFMKFSWVNWATKRGKEMCVFKMCEDIFFFLNNGFKRRKKKTLLDLSESNEGTGKKQGVKEISIFG